MTQNTRTPTNTPEEILHQIRQAKLSYLSHIFNALILEPELVDIYMRHDTTDYIDFLGQSLEKIESIQGDSPLISSQAIESFDPEVVARLPEVCQSMQVVYYTAPLSPDEQLMHLFAMWTLFNADCVYPPTPKDLNLDFSFLKLVIRVHQDLISRAVKGQREFFRTKKSTQAKRKNAVPWQQVVLAIYKYGDPIASGTRLSRAIVMIQSQFEESKVSKLKESNREDPKWGAIPDSMTTPKRDSIKSLLTKEGLLKIDFEKKGNYWFKMM